jgi:hypothetical protein
MFRSIFVEGAALFALLADSRMLNAGTIPYQSALAGAAVTQSSLANICQNGLVIGNGGENMFASQSAFVLPVPAQPDSFIFMADRWNPKDLPDSCYIWLPFTMESNGNFTISWRDHWNFSALPTGRSFRLESLNEQDSKPDAAITRRGQDDKITLNAQPVL